MWGSCSLPSRLPADEGDGPVTPRASSLHFPPEVGVPSPLLLGVPSFPFLFLGVLFLGVLFLEREGGEAVLDFSRRRQRRGVDGLSSPFMSSSSALASASESSRSGEEGYSSWRTYGSGLPPSSSPCSVRGSADRKSRACGGSPPPVPPSALSSSPRLPSTATRERVYRKPNSSSPGCGSSAGKRAERWRQVRSSKGYVRNS